MDPYQVEMARARTPKFNRMITNGLAVEHMMGRASPSDRMNKTVAWIDKLFRINQGLFPEGFVYEGARPATPMEHFDKITREYNSKRKANVAAYDTYMVTLNFSYYGEKLMPCPILLPYVRDGGLMHLNGALYSVSPVLADVGYSVIQGSIFIPFIRTKLTFNSLDYHFLTNNKRDIHYVLWSLIHLKKKELSARDVNKRKMLHTSIAHYFFAQFGVIETFRDWGDCDVKIGYSYEFSEEEYPESHYTRFESINLKGKGPAGELCILIPNEDDSDFIRLLVAGFFYVMDTFPNQFTEPEHSVSKIRWQDLLGQLIYGDYRHLGKVKQDIEDHLESFSNQLDEITRDELRQRGVVVKDSWELLYKISTDLLHHFYQRSSDESSVYGKRLTVLRYVLEQLNHAISSFTYQFQSLKRKKEEEGGWKLDDLNAHVRKYFKLNTALNALPTDHGEINTVAYPGDNKFFRITSTIIPQDRAHKKNGFQKGLANDETKMLHVSLAVMCQFNNQPKNVPDGRGKVNQYGHYTIDGVFVPDPTLDDIVVPTQRLFQR